MTNGTGGATSLPGTGGVLTGVGGSLIAIYYDAGAGGMVGTGGAVPGTGGAVVSGVGGTVPVGTGGQIDAAARGAGAAIDGGTAGEAGTVGCDQDLSGTWDLLATSLGTGIVRGVLTVKKEGFSLSTSSALLTFDAEGPSATWRYRIPWSGQTSTRVISVQSTPAAVNTGSFPIALGGHWRLARSMWLPTRSPASAPAARATTRSAARIGHGSSWTRRRTV